MQRPYFVLVCQNAPRLEALDSDLRRIDDHLWALWSLERMLLRAVNEFL